MFRWNSILGDLLITMGQHDRSEALFHYFRLEDQVPETHLLRLIEKHVSFAFVRQHLKDRYPPAAVSVTICRTQERPQTACV